MLRFPPRYNKQNMALDGATTAQISFRYILMYIS
jgi:hypothetical protein